MDPRRLSRRGALLAGAAIASGCATPARRGTLEVITADVRPLAIDEGAGRGLVVDILAEAAGRAGYGVRWRFLPFAQAAAAAAAEEGSLMTPLARSAQREASYGWIARIVDVPQAMGTLRGRPVVDLDGARRLASVGVVRAGVQEGFLKDNGFTNLAARATARELAVALAAGEIDAWYGTATEIAVQFEAIGRAGEARVGPTLQSAPVWLAGHRTRPHPAATALAQALATMEQDGSAQRHYLRYVPG